MYHSSYFDVYLWWSVKLFCLNCRFSGSFLTVIGGSNFVNNLWVSRTFVCKVLNNKGICELWTTCTVMKIVWFLFIFKHNTMELFCWKGSWIVSQFRLRPIRIRIILASLCASVNSVSCLISWIIKIQVYLGRQLLLYALYLFSNLPYFIFFAYVW
jgi:hypothetical protein